MQQYRLKVIYFSFHNLLSYKPLLFHSLSLRGEMVDTADSKSANASCGGSSPPAGTTHIQKYSHIHIALIC